MNYLICDDDGLAAQGMKSLILSLAPQAHIDVVHDTGSATMACHGHNYDIVFLDVRFGSKNSGLEMLKQLRGERHFRGSIVMISGFANAQTIEECFRYGASSFVVKAAGAPEDFLSAIQACLNKQTYIPEATLAVIQEYRARIDAPNAEHVFSSLSKREWEVASYLAHGYTRRMISQQLSISEETVKAHLTSVFRKLKVSTQLEFMAILLAENLQLPEPEFHPPSHPS